MHRARRSSVVSVSSTGSSGSQSARRSSVPSLNLQQPGVTGHRPFLTQRRRGSQQQQQQQQQDSLKSISESGKPTLELAAYASEEFVNAMREAAAAKFTVVPSRQLPPHLRRMSEPAVFGSLAGGARPRGGDRRHSVHALVDGPPVAFLSKKSQFGSADSGQLSSFAELDEAMEADPAEDEAAEATARLTARSLLRGPSPSPLQVASSNALTSSMASTKAPGMRSQRRKVSIDSAVYVH